MKLEQLLDGRDLVVFDLETTGTSTKVDRIVQFAGIRVFADGRPRQTYARMVNPGIPIPPGASEVHGITDERVAEEPPLRVIAPEIVRFLADADLGGYNLIVFDIPLLQVELARCGLSFEMRGRRILDGMLIFKHFERRDLSSALEFYCGVEHETAHDALGDVQATIDVIEAQVDRYEELPSDMEGLHRLILGRRVTPDGKLIWQEGEACIGFGKHSGVPLRLLVQRDPGYIDWMLKSDFPDDVVEILKRARRGEFPQP
jgi:DNA polymerase III subunit epsilon